LANAIHAHTTLAIECHKATHVLGTGYAFTTAIGISLIAILNEIITRCALANVIHAHTTLAIKCHRAIHIVCTRCTVTATIHVTFKPVVFTVGTRRLNTLTLNAFTCSTLCTHATPFGCLADKWTTTTTIYTRLITILNTIIAVCEYCIFHHHIDGNIGGCTSVIGVLTTNVC
jgi:hypothetical protein